MSTVPRVRLSVAFNIANENLRINTLARQDAENGQEWPIALPMCARILFVSLFFRIFASLLSKSDLAVYFFEGDA